MSKTGPPSSELTVRAVVSGLFVGCLIAASNVAIGLKIGWTFGAAITSAVISFALFSTIKSRPFTPKETLISATGGSSAGTLASAGGFVSAIPALEMIRANNGLEPLSFAMLLAWGASVAFLGSHFAVPLRRQMVVVEKLRYPTGTATAETIKAMFASGAEAVKKTRVLLWAGIGAALLKLLYLIEPIGLSPFEVLGFDDFGLFTLAILGVPLYQLSLGLNLSPMMFGAGILIGPKVGWSLFGGAIIAWAVITPILINKGVVEIMPDMAQVRTSMAAEAAGASEKEPSSAEAELRRHLDDELFRAQRIADNRDGWTVGTVIAEYTRSDIINLYDSLSDDLIAAAKDGTLSETELPDKQAATKPHLDAAAALLVHAGANTSYLDSLRAFAKQAQTERPVEHLLFQLRADLARESMTAIRYGESNFDAISGPYIEVAERLDAEGITTNAAEQVRARADALLAETRQLLEEEKPLLTLKELNLESNEHKRTLTIGLPDTTSPYRAGFNWVLWPGVAVMITASLTALALQWRTVLKTFSSLAGVAKGAAHPADDDGEPDAPDPYPMSWWIIGMTIATAITVTLAWYLFEIPIWMGILGVIMSLLLASIAVRATGETDINPVGAMGKITQAIYAALAPANMAINLMAAAVTSSGASQSGDLMHDFKAGYILKASIRRQVISQIIGVGAGVFAAAGTFKVLSAVYEIPGPEFPGPAVYAWYKMAEILSVGVDALPPGALWAALVGAGMGILFPIIHARFKKISPWLPSPVAFGIAFMVPAVYSMAMWLGSFVFYLYGRRHAERADKFGASMASGFIAGEGLMMVAFAMYLMATQVLF